MSVAQPGLVRLALAQLVVTSLLVIELRSYFLPCLPSTDPHSDHSVHWWAVNYSV